MTMSERRPFRRRNRPEDTPAPAPAPRPDPQAEALAKAQAEAEAQAEVQREAEAAAEDQRRRAEAAGDQARRQAEAAAQAQADAEAEEQRRQAEAAARTRAKAAAEARAAREAENARAQVEADAASAPIPATDQRWSALTPFPVDLAHLDRHRIVTARREDPAHTAFDILRTKLVQTLAERGWSRVAITSPTKDCGKTFTAANLAISLSRQEALRTVLLDCDLRRPSLHKVMGVKTPGSMGDMLRGRVPAEQHLLRMGPNSFHAGPNLAFGFNQIPESYPAELLQDPGTATALAALQERLKPDVMLFDLPPALYFDDVMAFRAQFDGVLLVIGGGLSTEKEIREVERRLGDQTPLLGMILNKAEGTNLGKYSY
ncbi:MAG TPA: exopolysaccharide biosynthesis protein [Citreicella sp.]|jgi:Mrp family chromosome partitioning ATPase|nr:exopolysaccharide biosynthesis protein [Citreicella sp.]